MMPQRHLSLDIFRGATVALMILVNNPGTWSHLYPPLAHAPWHGVTLTDLVFPFFLFAVGNAMAFALTPAVLSAPTFHAKVFKRTLWIFGLGLFLNAAPFVRWSPEGDLVLKELGNLRLLGVLQRIAVAYCMAALLVRYVPQRALPLFVGGGLLAYWGLCISFGVQGDPWSLEGFWGTGIDRALLGANHLYKGEGVPFDPEGLASTLPCVAQVLIGYLVGNWLRQGLATPARLVQLAAAGFGALLLGLLWAELVPLNKKIWTSSYVVLTSGWAMLTLAALSFAVEVRGWQGGWSRFCVAFGCNALFIFCLSGFVPRVIALLRWPAGVSADGAVRYTTPTRWVHDVVIAPWFSDPRAGSLMFAIVNLCVYWLIARWMMKRGIFIKV
jgi:predicted acyltransferase